MKASTDTTQNPRKQERDLLIKDKKEDGDQVKTNIERRTCFSKGLKATLICSCFFLIKSTRSYFSSCKDNNNSKPSCKSNIQQYSNIFCHYIGGQCSRPTAMGKCPQAKIGQDRLGTIGLEPIASRLSVLRSTIELYAPTTFNHLCYVMPGRQLLPCRRHLASGIASSQWQGPGPGLNFGKQNKKIQLFS